MPALSAQLSLRTAIAMQSLVLVLVVFIVWSSKSYVPQTPINLDQSTRLQQCRIEIQNELKPKELTLDTLGEIHGLCYARVDEEDVLQEFGVRRSAYVNQQYQVPIMLWMVVAITLSGVGLAGLQLLAGYRLALAGAKGLEPNGEISLEPKKIAVNSTVTGVLILFISLAFFYVFVKYVYLIKELPIPPANSEAGTPDLHGGWGQYATAPLTGAFGNLPNPTLKAEPAPNSTSGTPATSTINKSKLDR